MLKASDVLDDALPFGNVPIGGGVTTNGDIST